METIEKLARAFCAELAEYIGDEAVAEVARLNREAPILGVCYAHDYCDANMAMAGAFETVQGYAPRICEEEHSEADVAADTELWSSAWNYAQAHDYFVEAQS